MPPPPATGMSSQPMPWLPRFSFSTLSAAASPPEVHQCRTSTSSACAMLAVSARTATEALRPYPNLFISLSLKSADIPLDIHL